MTLNELMIDVALFGECGDVKKIKEEGWDSEEQFLDEFQKLKGIEWSYYKDGRKVMILDKANGEGGWDCKFVVKDGWVATFNYALLEIQMEERKNKKEKSRRDDYEHYDDDDLYYYDDDDGHEDYGLDDYNDDYGWWR